MKSIKSTRYINAMVSFLLICLLSSCAPSSPGDVARQYIDAIAEHDCEKALSMVVPDYRDEIDPCSTSLSFARIDEVVPRSIKESLYEVTLLGEFKYDHTEKDHVYVYVEKIEDTWYVRDDGFPR